MLNVVCVKWGSLYGADYVNILHDMVTRNLALGTEGRFVCFTDDPHDPDLHPDIETRALPGIGLKGWWNKLYLFKDGLFADGDRVLYFDLDTVITGPLDEIAAYDGSFAILRDFYRPDGLQSSVMAWEANKHGYLWEGFEAFGYPEIAGGDQAWIEKNVESFDIWQKLYPGSFCSFKAHARFGIPKGTKVVIFHGEPRPHQAGEWVPNVWKIGGGTSAELICQANVSEDVIKANIQFAEMDENGEWLEMKPAHNGVALICAGGPSLRESVETIRAHQSVGASVFAVNGTYRHLRSNSIFPDAHVILDARRENEKFLPEAWEMVDRYYSSQCDPRVLRAKGAYVTYFHPAIDGILDVVGRDKERTYVGGGTTVGMKAVAIAFLLGYRKIHLFGFDSCYRAKEHHAYPQSLNDNERILDVTFNGKSYRCAPWMIQQAEDFEEYAPQLIDHGVELAVHGTGLIADIAKVMSQPGPRSAADARADAILSKLQGKPNPKVAEVGVFAGDLSRKLLARRPDLELVMIDAWGKNLSVAYEASEDFHSGLSPEAQEHCRALTEQAVSFAGNRAKIIRDLSQDAARMLEDESLDLAFIDADHSYEGCKADIEAYYPKVRPGGFLSGHDYANNEWKFGPMVKKAVDEFVEGKGLSLELGENFTWFARKPQEQTSV